MLSDGHAATAHARATRAARARILGAEDRVPCDERVGAGMPHLRDRLAVDAAIHLERGPAADLVEQRARTADLVDRCGMNV